jgi:ABC-type multidrug transport system permease subunit
MPLSRIVVRLYAVLIEIALWLVLIGSFIGGWQANGFLGALGSVIVATILASVFFGAFLVINEIRDKVAAIEARRPQS